MTFRHLLLLFTTAIGWHATAQTTIPVDSSGNGMLQGNYYFRQAVYSTDSNGNIVRATAVYGLLTFDGGGHFTVNGQQSDSQTSAGQPAPFTANGQTLTYAIGSNGLGYLDNPLVSGEQVVGLVSQGVFAGSSTEGQLNDLMFAVPAGKTPPTNASLTGNYWVAYMNIPSGNPTTGTDAIFQMNANGNGGFTGTISASGYAGAATTATTQSIQGATYSFTNGVGTLALPASGTLISGNKLFYVSPDGNFLIGGSPSGYDLFAAVRSATGLTNASFTGLYYTAGMEEDLSTSGSAVLETHYGSLYTTGAGTIIRHDRLAPFDATAFNQTYDDYYSLNADGTFTQAGLSPFFTPFDYVVGTGGLGFVGIGEGPYPGVIFGVQAPNPSGSGVYLYPTGVVNAASFAPFTTGVAPGEWISLFGTNLASATVQAGSVPFPTSLGGVQVSINGTLAPLQFVSPNQINAIVPWATTQNFAQIQITNNGAKSNVVQVFTNDTLPGVYTQTSNGVGPGSITHANYQLVTASNPAQVGETLLVYLTGLGTVNPSVPDGAVGSITAPFNPTTNQINVWIDGIPATVIYAGLAPGLAGYQVNVTIPQGVTPGRDVYVDIDTPDAYVSQTTIRMQ